VDPVYHAGGAYYLAPQGPVVQKPDSLIHKVMVTEGQHALQVVLPHVVAPTGWGQGMTRGRSRDAGFRAHPDKAISTN